MPRLARLLVAVLLSVALSVAAGATPASARAATDPTYLLISATPTGTSGDNASFRPFVSADGRRVLFGSAADDLVAGGISPGGRDVFLRRLDAGTTIDLTPDADDRGRPVGLSDDGSVALLISRATNLVRPRTDGEPHLFVRRAGRGLEQIDLTRAGGQPADGKVIGASLSANGQVVAFLSSSTDLVRRDVTGGIHVYRHDLRTGRTTVLDARADGDSGSPSIDGAGDTIAFTSSAGNLVPGQVAGRRGIVVWEQGEGLAALVRDPGSGWSFHAVLSRDGRTAALETAAPIDPEDDHAAMDIYVVDVATGSATWVTRTAQNAESFDPSVSARGRWVAFTSYASFDPADTSDRADIYRFRRGWPAPRVVTPSEPGFPSAPSADSLSSSLNGDGKLVAFATYIAGVVPGDGNGTFDVVLADYR